MKAGKALKVVGISVLSIAVLLALYILSLLGGADYTTYPDEKASAWICNDPHIELHFHKLVTDSYLEWDGEKIPVVVAMQSNVFDVYRKALPQEGLKEENILFRGYWHYEGKDMVVEICEDNIFNGVYIDLTFTPQ